MSATVLFIHGLESGPYGHKSRVLQHAGFTVVAGQMPSSKPAIFSDPVVITVGIAALWAVTACAWFGGGWAFLVALALVVAGAWASRPLLVRRMFSRSLQVQRDLLRNHAIDVVFGSSFGGAVAVELIRSGAWNGPTVLLCPAHGLVANRASRPVPSLPEGMDHLVIVHGRPDATVPFAHSQTLVKNTRGVLVEVEDEHRLTETTTPDNVRAWIALAIHGSGHVES